MKIRVFLSWSGERSKQFARELKWWLPRVVHGVSPWLSEADIAKGQRWSDQIGKQLQEHHVGIICLTPEALGAEWLLYEAGALSKALGDARVCPILLGMRPSDLDGPLAQFQATVFEKEDMLALARSLNAQLDQDRADDAVVEDAFAQFWPEIQKRVGNIAKLTLSGQAMPQVVRTFAKYGLPAPSIGSSAFFAEGFESHAVYKTICDIATQRLYVFGRKNRKLFDKEHRDFFNGLPARVASGFEFRCLFLDPASEPHVLSSAHEDPDFLEQLRTSIRQAYKGLHAAGINPADHCRIYHIVRTTTAIVVDDAVLFAHIRMNQEGRAKRLTKCGFTIVNADSALGTEILQEFLALWSTSTPLPQL